METWAFDSTTASQETQSSPVPFLLVVTTPAQTPALSASQAAPHGTHDTSLTQHHLLQCQGTAPLPAQHCSHLFPNSWVCSHFVPLPQRLNLPPGPGHFFKPSFLGFFLFAFPHCLFTSYLPRALGCAAGPTPLPNCSCLPQPSPATASEGSAAPPSPGAAPTGALKLPGNSHGCYMVLCATGGCQSLK